MKPAPEKYVPLLLRGFPEEKTPMQYIGCVLQGFADSARKYFLLSKLNTLCCTTSEKLSLPAFSDNSLCLRSSPRPPRSTLRLPSYSGGCPLQQTAFPSGSHLGSAWRRGTSGRRRAGGAGGWGWIAPTLSPTRASPLLPLPLLWPSVVTALCLGSPRSPATPSDPFSFHL